MATNVDMILGYVEARMRRVAKMGGFEKLKQGDLRKLEIGFSKILRQFKKDIRKGYKLDVTFKDVRPVNGRGLYPELHNGSKTTHRKERFAETELECGMGEEF